MTAFEKVVARQQPDGSWSVVTAFLGFTVGDYLGPCDGLTKDKADELVELWADMQAGNEGLKAKRRPKLGAA